MSTDPTTPSAVARWRRSPGLIIGAGILSVIILIAILAPIFLQEQADALQDRAAPPSRQYWLGTDAAGHDMFARSLVATRLTLGMTFVATAISVIVGIFLGTSVWLLPPRIRELGLRVIDAMVAFPGLLFALAVAAILGAGASSAVIAIGVAGIPYFARLTANLAAKVSQQEFVTTARLLGVGPRRTITSHMLPNMSEPLLVLTASTFAQALTSISALSFVGLGVQAPQYDFGKLLNDALPSMLAGRPHQLIGPAALIIITGVAAMLIGDGLAAAANPRGGALAGKTSTSSGTRLADDVEAMVKVENLLVTNSAGVPLVKGISFSIAAGEIVGVVGESGSGKSLTAMSVARLLPDGLDMSADRMSLDDLDLLGDLDPRTLATTVGLVYQDPGSTFNPALRMQTQLTEVLRTHQGMDRKSARELILSALRTVQITLPEKRLGQLPRELSGGMRQRAMIASALAVNPRLVIADEPTTALDVTVQAGILREFKRINRELGTAILFISHDIGVVQELCDRVLVMNGGEILEEVSAENLTVDRVNHPYTKALLAATPSLTDKIDVLPTMTWTRESEADA